MLASFLLWVKWVLTNAKTVLSFVITLKSAKKSKEQEGPGERGGLLRVGRCAEAEGRAQPARMPLAHRLLPPGPQRERWRLGLLGGRARETWTPAGFGCSWGQI